MCMTCGCGEGEARIEGEAHGRVHRHADGTVHSHAHAHAGAHEHASASEAQHEPPPGRMVQIEQDILAKNQSYADANRALWRERGIFALNFVSSPGSGKTTLLARSIELLAGRLPLAVIEGDQQTSNDAERIRAAGAQAIQVNTGRGCHLDAHMVGHACDRLHLAGDALLLIENVGNLVCPAEFDLGEAHKVVILSVTEGEDKPLKYPNMFAAADLMLLTKIDLLPYVRFDAAQAIDYARRVNPDIEFMQLSAETGVGMQRWIAWLERGAAAARKN